MPVFCRPKDFLGLCTKPSVFESMALNKQNKKNHNNQKAMSTFKTTFLLLLVFFLNIYAKTSAWRSRAGPPKKEPPHPQTRPALLRIAKEKWSNDRSDGSLNKYADILIVVTLILVTFKQ